MHWKSKLGLRNCTKDDSRALAKRLLPSFAPSLRCAPPSFATVSGVLQGCCRPSHHPAGVLCCRLPEFSVFARAAGLARAAGPARRELPTVRGAMVGAAMLGAEPARRELPAVRGAMLGAAMLGAAILGAGPGRRELPHMRGATASRQ